MLPRHAAPLLLLAAPLAASSGSWTKVTLDSVRYPLALCLDGSPGAFYVSPGADPRVLIHVQGGGWCTSVASCAQRADPSYVPYAGQSSLGSSTPWAASGCAAAASAGGGAAPQPAPVCVADGGDHGALSADPAVNPLFYNWTKAFIGYCSGDSLAGAAEAPIAINATSSFYFRGRYILDGALDTLLSSHGLAAAPVVVYKGCSAGGMAVFLSADRVRARVLAANPAALFLAAPGAGAILHTPAIDGTFPLDPQLQWLWATANMSGSAAPACLAAHPGAGHMCFYPQVSLPYTATPLFVSNSLADLAQASAVMGLNCTPTTPGSCSAAQLAYLNEFRVAMLAGLAPVLASDAGGAWLPECFVHVLENDDYEWSRVVVVGQTQRDTFAAWFAARSGGAPPPGVFAKAVDGGWGSNPTCAAPAAARRYPPLAA